MIKLLRCIIIDLGIGAYIFHFHKPTRDMVTG